MIELGTEDEPRPEPPVPYTPPALTEDERFQQNIATQLFTGDFKNVIVIMDVKDRVMTYQNGRKFELIGMLDECAPFVRNALSTRPT